MDFLKSAQFGSDDVFNMKPLLVDVVFRLLQTKKKKKNAQYDSAFDIG